MDMLLLMKQRGRKVEKNFTKTCWDEVIAKIKEETGREPDIYNAKNKLKTWRARYKEVRQLLNMSRFGWDDTKKMVTDSNEVWQDLVQAKNKLSKYRTIHINFFDEIHDLVADDVAEGNIAMTGAERSTIDVEAMMTDEEFVNITFGSASRGLDDMDDGSLPQMDEETNGASRPPPTPTTNRNAAKKRKTMVSDEIRDTLASVATAVNSLAERINTPEPVHILMNKVTTAVTSCPFIPLQAYVHVTEYLAKDISMANLFFTYNDQRKQQWYEIHYLHGLSSSGH